MDTPRILITGAQGFIGRYAVAAFLDRFPNAQILGIGRSPGQLSHFTHKIVVLDREMAAPVPRKLAERLDDPRYEYQPVDICDLAAMSDCVREFRPTVIVHLAGALRGENLERLLPLNVAAIETLFDAVVASHAPLPRIVHGSSGSVYGTPTDDELPVTESKHPVPFDDYSISKYAGELVGQVRAKRHGMAYARARIFNVVGPGQDERHICGRIASQILEIEHGLASSLRLGTLTTTRDFVDVRDVASSLATLVESGDADGIYNVASGREVAMSTLLKTLTAVAGHDDLDIDFMPPRPDDNPRICADVTRIAGLAHRSAFSLEASCQDVIDYYRQLVDQPEPAPARPRHSSIPVTVDRSDEYIIEVEPGLIEQLPARLAASHPGALVAILTDDVVKDLYATRLRDQLRANGTQAELVSISPGDTSKSFESFRSVIEQLRQLGLDRRGVLVTVGGGMICDLGGFVASAYLRGVSYINVPTTLLGQCDASIGGKVAINAPWAKNFIGAFHHPEAVYLDPLVLRTLDPREVAAGIAEIIKVAVITDPELFDDLVANVGPILHDQDPEVLQRILVASAQAKVDMLAPDPYESDLRRVLNFGHTYAHPLETEHGYAGILHGEAVAWGMVVATYISETRGLIDPSDAVRIVDLIIAYGLPPEVPHDVLRAAVRHLDGVRLVRANKLHYVLPTAVGATTIVGEVSDAEVLAAVDRAVERLASSAVATP